MNGPQCPWGFLKPGTIHFCEESLCAWITEPANAWSNIGFVIAGILILRKNRGPEQFHLKWLGWISILIGLCSGFFHSTSSLLGQTIDFGSMFMVTTFMVVINLSRWLKVWSTPLFAGGLVFLLLSLASLTLFPVTGIPVFGFQFILAMLIEVLIVRQQKPAISHRPLFMLLGLFAVSLGVWLLDITGTVCSPTNHIFTGHSLWHLLNAAAVFSGGNFYAQFTCSVKSSGSQEARHF